ncbi:30S ribosomal protein S21 [Candidatus Azambacteria bacterium]|nr:30S ribosomal protein S21 [Candidatus Azambacteria bacterium]
MIEARRRDKESVGAFLRRFSRKVQQSHVLVKARKYRYLEPKKSKRKVKEAAIRRSKIASEKEMLYKLGKITENEYKRGS